MKNLQELAEKEIPFEAGDGPIIHSSKRFARSSFILGYGAMKRDLMSEATVDRVTAALAEQDRRAAMSGVVVTWKDRAMRAILAALEDK